MGINLLPEPYLYRANYYALLSSILYKIHPDESLDRLKLLNKPNIRKSISDLDIKHMIGLNKHGVRQPYIGTIYNLDKFAVNKRIIRYQQKTLTNEAQGF